MLERLVETAPGVLLSLAGIFCGTLFLLTWVTWHYWHYSRLHARETEFKRDMLARGLGTGDIERILWVSHENAPYCEDKQAPETLSKKEYTLLKKLIDNGSEPEQLERLVRALKHGSAQSPTQDAEPKREVRPEDVSLELT